MRLAKVFFGRSRRFAAFAWDTFGWQPRSDILGALDFCGVAVVVHFLVDGLAANGFGPGLRGVAVGALLAMAQPASGTEAHASPASPGEISFTHNK
jgi:hypothetical protein